MMNQVEQERIHAYYQLLEQSDTLGIDIKPQTDFKDAMIRYVLAPSLNGYIQWVLNQAKERQIKRLYFLSRDGYLMYQVAKCYCEKLALPIDCRYLYCSRYSIRIPTYYLDINEAIDYICRNGIAISRQSILDRMGILEENIDAILEILGWERRNLLKEIQRIDLGKIKKELKNNQQFITYLAAYSRKQYENMQAYFRQEGLYEEVLYAIVDSGWTGTTQRTFSKILEASYRKTKLVGFYWGLYEVPNDMDSNLYSTYYFAPYKEIHKKARFSNCLFESMYSAPHGMTMAYQCNEQGKYVPCLDAVRITQKEYMEHIEILIIEYTNCLLQQCKNSCFYNIDQDKKIIETMMSRFMSKPIKQEVEAFGTILFCDDILDCAKQKIACDLTRQEIKHNRIHYKILNKFGYGQIHICESAWIEGSIVRNGIGVQYDLWQQYMYKCLLYMKQAIVRGIKK